MIHKNWIVFKVTTYLCLVIALLLSTVLVYLVISEDRKSALFWMELLVSICIPVSQIAFQILNIRLFHFFLPNDETPDKPFKTMHTTLLVFNLIWVLLFCALMVEAIGDLRRQVFVPNSVRSLQELIFGLIAAIIVLNVYSILGSLQLRNYLQVSKLSKERQWLESLGEDGPMP